MSTTHAIFVSQLLIGWLWFDAFNTIDVSFDYGIAHNTPLTNSLKPLIQILQSRSTQSGLSMSKLQENNLVYIQQILETLVKMNICCHMIYMLVKM